MANLAKIQSISEGQFFVKDSLGNLVELKVGDTVSLNDTIVAASSNTDLSKIEILFDTNELVVLSQGETLLDETLLASTFGNEELAFDKQEVDETLNAWNNAQDGDETDMETAAGDVTEQATNAGNEEAEDGGALRSKFDSRESKFNSRDGDLADVVSDLREASFGGATTQEPQEQIPTELLNPAPVAGETPAVPETGTETGEEPTPEVPEEPETPETPEEPEVPETTPFISTVTLTSVGSGDEDGATVTYTATFTTAPTKDETVSFKVDGKDYSISVIAGELTGTTPLTYKNKDVIVDPTEIPVATDLAITNNSNYDDLTAVNSSTKYNIEDSIDITKINVTAENSTDGKNIILNVSLTNKDGLDTKVTNTPLEVVLNDEIKITIPVGETEGSITIPNPIKTGGEFTYSVDLIKTTGGNYEKLEGSSTTITTKDIIPPVISIVGSEAEEVKAGTSGKVKISINKVLDNDLDVIFTHNNKEYKVTIEKGKNSVTETVETNRKDDYYKQDTTTEDIVIIKTSNDDIVIKDENGEPNIKDKITIKDDVDPVAVKITAVQTTDKVIDIKNVQNNEGFNVFAKDPYGNKAVIAIHGNPAGFGVQRDKETTSGKLGQTDKVYSGHTSEIGVVKDETTGKYLSESIEVVFKNPIQTLDVAFAWRHNGERAKVDFYNNGNEKVGYAIVKGGGSNTKATVEYYDKNGGLKESVQAQGGTDRVDDVYTFKPAGDVTFTKAVFSADGAGSDYLIHSIKYKEAVGGDNTTVVGSQEVAFKIETSVKPDPIWIEKGNTPTAYVNIVDSAGNEVFKGPVNLDKDGKSIVTVRTDGNVNFTATVTDVKGNFEDVNYAENSVTITGSLLPTASNDSITTNEDTPYTLTKDDFGNIGNTTNTQNVAKIKFDTVPANGTIYVLKTEYTASMNDRAEYTISESNDKVEAGDIVDISQIEKGNVIFVPNKNSDTNGEFKFKVSSGGISDSSFKNVVYTTTIDVKAVADAPTVSIDVTKIEIQNTGNSQIVTIRNPENFKQVLNGSDNSGNPNAGHKVEIFSNKTTNSVSISLEIENPKQLSGEVRFFDINGNHLEGKDVSINESTVPNKSGNKTYEGTFSPVGGGSFASFEVANIGEESAFDLVGYKYDISGDIADSNEYSFYKVDISSHLTDTDGSETLSVVIKNVPADATLESNKYDVSKKSDGSWSVNFKEGTTGDALLKIEDSLTMKVPQNGEINLQIEATSTDKSTDGTSEVSQAISFDGSGDIDLSNLKNIVNLKEINLDNGKENKLSLTLDDVLELSGDNKIKITVDEFDSVTLKNEEGKTWQEGSPVTEDSKTFETYTNSGDSTVQVKVEQPISEVL